MGQASLGIQKFKDVVFLLSSFESNRETRHSDENNNGYKYDSDNTMS